MIERGTTNTRPSRFSLSSTKKDIDPLDARGSEFRAGGPRGIVRIKIYIY